MAAAVGRLRGSGGKVNSTPSPAGPVIEANSRDARASPAIRMRLEALVAHLSHDQPGFLVITAVIDDIDIVELELGNERGEILVALVEGLVELFFHAGGIERLLHLVGEAFAVRRLVVDDGDVFAVKVFRQIVGGEAALLVIASASAKRVPHAAFGE